MSKFDEAVNYVLDNEKELEENPKDSGGITKFGISLRELISISGDNLKKYGIYETPTADTIRNLKITTAKDIYLGEYWSKADFGAIIDQNVCNFIFDMAVNEWIAEATKCAQRACWAVLKKWKFLLDDGVMGPKTIAAINQCGILLMPALRAERGAFYREVVRVNPSKKEFLNGWLNRTYNT